MQIIKYKISKIEINLFLIDHKYFVIFANQVLKSKTVFFLLFVQKTYRKKSHSNKRHFNVRKI